MKPKLPDIYAGINDTILKFSMLKMPSTMHLFEPQFKNILILGHQNIGDILHNMAILKPLHKALPQAKISILTAPIGKALLEGNPYLHEILIFDKKGEWKTWQGKLKTLHRLRQKKFGLAINLKSGSYVCYFLGVKKVWGIRKVDKTLTVKRNSHAIDIYLNVLRNKGIPFLEEDIDLKVQTTQKDDSDLFNILKHTGFQANKPFIVFAPFSAWHAKEWAYTSYGKLSEILVHKHGFQVVLVGGKEDQQKVHQFEPYTNTMINLVGKTSLKQLAALYKKAMLVIGGDSGPFHLATNMRRPVLGIFAPTSHLRARPYFEPQNTIYCQKELGCNPCIPGRHFMACDVWNRTTPCMETISFDAVYEKTLAILDVLIKNE